MRHRNDTNESAIIAEAVDCIVAGGTLIFPTETVYGIGAAAENDAAIAAVYTAKGRRFDKPLALHVSELAQAQPFVRAWTRAALRAVQHFWPGPLAVIVPRRAARFEKAAAGYATISLRCPDHGLTRNLLRQTGPLAATSANRANSPAFTGAPDALPHLPEATLALIAGLTAYQRESTIMDCSTEHPRILRWGAIGLDRITAVMGTLEPSA